MLADELLLLARGLGQDVLARMAVSLVGAAHEFIGIADLDGNALFVNEAGRRLVGLRDPDAVRATRVIDYFAPHDQQTVLDEVLPAVRRTGFWEGELNFRHFETGTIFPVLYNIFPIVDAAGAVAAYGTVTRDLTETRDADHGLRYLAAIVESSDDAIVSKNLGGIITSWNQGAERIFGYSATEAVGQSITILIPKDRLDEETEILRRIKLGERIEHFETIRQRKDGRLINVSLTVSPVKNAAGTVIGASKIARDVTEQKRTQEQIITLGREAEHRSKNLLQTVHAAVKLSNADTPQGLKDAIEGRILALANVHSLFVETRWVGAELSDIARQELAPYTGKKQTRIHIDGPKVVLDPNTAQAIAVILHELATNAAKYGAFSEGKGHIDLTWQRTADGPLTVRWSESGGPPAQKPSRLGFGTRVTQSMIKQLKGETRFDWRPEGLTCEITFPA